MTTNVSNLRWSALFVKHPRRCLVGWGVAVLLLGLSGCAAMRPLKGVNAGELPDEYRLPQRSAKAMIDLSMLRRSPPRQHIVDADDVLSIYVEGYLGGAKGAPPLTMRQNPNGRSSLGYPIRVRDDGTISLPAVKPIHVQGMTILQVERAVRDAYTSGEKPPLVAGTERVFVDLQRPRHYRVLVMRQEAGGQNSVAGVVGQTNITQNLNKRGTGRVVSLPAYQNDVLHALAETGGLPGLDAENVIYVIRNHRRANRSQPIPAAAPPQPVAPQPAPVLAPVPILAPPPRAKNFGADEQPDPNTTQPTSAEPASAWDLSQRRRARNGGRIVLVRGQSPDSSSSDAFGGHSPLPSLSAPTPQRRPVARRVKSIPAGYPTYERESGPTMSAPSVGATTAVVPYHAPAYSEYSPRASSQQWPAVHDLSMLGPNVVRIPLRLIPGEIPTITEEDITLHEGDVVLIDSRQTDVFFTGGLLGGGRFTLPRDNDLDVLQALAIVQSQPVRSYSTRAIGGPSATNQDVTVGASNLMILRRRADGSQISIRVDLYKAMRDPNERVLVQAGDHLILQYTRIEACAAFFERHILEGAILGGSSGLFFSN